MKKASAKSKTQLIDEETLRAFAKGQLDEATEDEIVALLDRNPELQAKVAAISIDPVVEKMRVHSQVVVEKSLSSQLGETSADRSLHTSESIDVPAELEALSEFRIIKELGRGGMGVVYLAENTWMGNRHEVLKVLNEKLVDSGDAKERFQQEIEVTAALDHPSIVKSHSVRPLKSVVVFSMEYVKGKDLHGFISENGRLPVHVACSIAVDVCEGLQHAMKKGAIHRDIKPSNIMLYKDDNRHIRAKILDFGLARLGTRDRAQGLTEYGSLLGTLEYISPEQSLNAASVDIRTDIYSLGCTLYHMLVGHPPFSGSPGELIMAHSQKIPPTVNLVQPTVPKAVGEVVAKMLAKQPERRFQQPQQIAEALKIFVSQKEVRRPVKPAPDTNGPANASVRETSVDHRPPNIPLQLSPSKTGATHAAIPLPAIRVEPKSVLLERKLARRPRKANLPRPVLIGLPFVAFVALLIAVLASGVLRVRTTHGTILFENLPEDADVFVDGDEVSITWNDGVASIKVAAGKRDVIVRKDGITIEDEEVLVNSNLDSQMAIHIAEGSVELGGLRHRDTAREVSTKSPTPALELRGAYGADNANWWIDHDTGELIQDSGGWNNWILFGDENWTDYTLTFEACKIGTEPHPGSFYAIYRAIGTDTNHSWQFGSYKNSEWTHVAYYVGGRRINRGNSIIRKMKSVKSGHWYKIEVRVAGDSFDCIADGVKMHHYVADQITQGRVGLASGGHVPCKFRNIKVTSPEGDILWEGLPELPKKE